MRYIRALDPANHTYQSLLVDILVLTQASRQWIGIRQHDPMVGAGQRQTCGRYGAPSVIRELLPSITDLGKMQSPDYRPRCVATLFEIENSPNACLSSVQASSTQAGDTDRCEYDYKIALIFALEASMMEGAVQVMICNIRHRTLFHYNTSQFALVVEGKHPDETVRNVKGMTDSRSNYRPWKLASRSGQVDFVTLRGCHGGSQDTQMHIQYVLPRWHLVGSTVLWLGCPQIPSRRHAMTVYCNTN